MTGLPRDVTPLADLLHGRAGAGPVRERRPVYVDLLPTCNAGCPASSPAEARLPRTWISILHGRVRAALAATTGVEGPDDVVKFLLAGADVVMTASALLRHGPEHATELIAGLSSWMERKGFASVDEFRGMLSAPLDTDEAAHERAGYVSVLRAANSSVYGPW